METVEIVIKMPKDKYDEVMTMKGLLQAMPDVFRYGVAVVNGTVLPKGHGRLGDLDAYLKDTPIRNVDDTWIKESYVYESIINAPTVIEADKEDYI